jgi:hypothetical protein
MVANAEGAAPLDAGRATETGHQAQWEAYERIARANGFWHHIEPWAAELTALRARLDASERVRVAVTVVVSAIENEGPSPETHRRAVVSVFHRDKWSYDASIPSQQVLRQRVPWRLFCTALMDTF